MLSTLLPFVGLVANLALAAPVVDTRSPIVKRAEPTYINFGTEFADRQEVLHEAFMDVLQMCDYIVEFDPPPFFTDYFNAEDQADVYDVYRNILGDAQSGQGGDVLGSITIDSNDFNNGCGDPTQLAYTVLNGLSSTIHFCDAMWNNGFRVKNEITLDSLGTTVSWRMEHIGQIMLHEFTHNAQIAGTVDNAYGPIDVRALTGDARTQNADSWAWFATHQLWDVLKFGGQNGFAAPAAGDDIDPRCQTSICHIM